MGHALLFLLCLVVAIPSGLFASSHRTPVHTLAIVTSFHGEHSSGVVREIKSEIQNILEIPEIQLEWRSLDEGPLRESFNHLVVARFGGDCTGNREDVRWDQKSTLGFAHVTDGKVIPFLEIDCGPIKRLIGGPSLQTPLALRETLLGRALGRVLAHELYHILTETTEHSRYGIARPELSQHDLTTMHLGFDPRDLEKIREKLLEIRPVAPLADGME